jgi:hypothetical protein
MFFARSMPSVATFIVGPSSRFFLQMVEIYPSWPVHRGR